MLIGVLLLFSLDPSKETVQVPDAKIISMNSEMVSYLNDHVGDVHDPFNRLQKLVHLVFDQNFLNLTYDNTHTKTAEETFATRNGNCLSFTNMFVAMARHLDLKVSYQEVYNAPSWERQGSVVLLNRHINAVVHIGGRSYVVDFNPYQERMELRTKIVPDSRAKAQYYNNLGAEYFQKRDTTNAIAYFRKALTIYPNLTFCWSNLGAALAFEKRYEEAEEAYLKAMNQKEQSYTAMSNLARLYRKTGKERRAVELEEKVERYRRRNPYFHFALGEEAYSLGSFEASISHYREALQRKPKEHEFHFALSKSYAHLGDMEKSLHHLKRARKFAPDMNNRNRYNDKIDALASN